MTEAAALSSTGPGKRISFVQMLIACVLAGLVIGAALLRFSITYLRAWIPLTVILMLPFLTTASSLLYALIWQVRKTKTYSMFQWWQGLIRFGVAFDLAEFGWSKICHLQLVMPASKLDLPYRSFTPHDLFWYFFSHSYLFACIIAGLQIAGALLLLFRRTSLVGVFVLLPVLANILLMDIFYNIGASVVEHASIMTAGVLYFLFIDFDRLKQFFFAATTDARPLHLSNALKMAIRLSIIYVPLLAIYLHGRPDKHPELTGKYEVKKFMLNGHSLYRGTCADSILSVVYFDIRNGCVFEFGTPERRWNGTYSLDNDSLDINWRMPADKPAFKGRLSPTAGGGGLMFKGTLGADSIAVDLTPATTPRP
jgi:hypothetical protein